MKVVSSRTYRGPNPYGYRPMIRLEVDLAELESLPTNRLPSFTDALLRLVPSLSEHECSYGQPGGLVRRLKEGTWLGHVVEHLAIELQCLAGTWVTQGKTRAAGAPGRYYVVYEYRDEDLGNQAGHLAIGIIRFLLPVHLQAGMTEEERGAFDYTRELSRLVEDYRSRTGPSTEAIIAAAEKLDIPWRRLNDSGLIQLGYGKRRKRLNATITGDTSHLAVELAQDKELTNRMLRDAGIPVPRSHLARTEEEAISAADKVGYPIVTKPFDGHHGKGVSVRCATPAQVREGFQKAAKFSRLVLVEEQLEGRDYRILVIKGSVAAVSERLPASVRGDGIHNLSQLIGIVNSNPNRGKGHEKILTRIPIDKEVFERIQAAGYHFESVLPAGEVVQLKGTANLSQGGTAIDRSQEIHPVNKQIAERAANAIGLDIAGVDIVTRDISRPIPAHGGGIVEVNAAPGLRMHLSPSQGESRPVAGTLIGALYPDQSSSRIPLIAITGTNGKTTTARMVAHILKKAGYYVGLTTTDGIYMDGDRILEGDMSGPWSARLVLSDPRVEVAVLETARGGILREGLGFDRCDIGAVLNVQADHLGLQGVENLEDMAYIKRLVVEVVREKGWAVLNADHALTRSMAQHSPGQICWFSMEGLDTETRSGRWVTASELNGASWICLREEERELTLLKASDIPATFDGAARCNTANALAAASICWGFGLTPSEISRGLRCFSSDVHSTPGRLNWFEVGSFSVIIDYAHNAAGLEALGDFLSRLSVRGRRLGVVGAPGDRRNEDLYEFGRLAGEIFDLLIIREDRDLRGRRPLETASILDKAASRTKGNRDRIHIIASEEEAVQAALNRAGPGDLVVCLAEDLEGVRGHVETRQSDSAEESQAFLEAVDHVQEVKTGTG